MLGNNYMYKAPQLERYEMITAFDYITQLPQRKIYGVYKVFTDGSISVTNYWKDRSATRVYLEYKNKHL